MAQSTAKLTYEENGVGNKESLLNVVTNISPEETPYLSKFGKSKASNTLHSWLTDSLDDPANSGHIEGADYSFSKPGARTRLSNDTQIFVTPVEVSRSQMAADAAGIDNEFTYQVAKKMKEHAIKIEKALVSGTGNSGATGTGRLLKGVDSWITTNVETGTGTGSEALTEDMFNDNLQDIWEAGGSPKSAYANGTQKRAISTFTGSATKSVEASTKEIVTGVDVYDSDFGRIKIYPHRRLPTDTVHILDENLWKVAIYRPTEKIDVAVVGSAKRMVIETELTLEARQEAGNGSITDLS
jgi:hypothetical protein